jgi:hypothetical protein
VWALSSSRICVFTTWCLHPGVTSPVPLHGPVTRPLLLAGISWTMGLPERAVRCCLHLFLLLDILPQIQKGNIDILRSKEEIALVLSLDKRQIWVNFTRRPQRRWNQPQSRSGVGREVYTPFPCRESNPNRPARSHSFYLLNCHGSYCPSLRQNWSVTLYCNIPALLLSSGVHNSFETRIIHSSPIFMSICCTYKCIIDT